MNNLKRKHGLQVISSIVLFLLICSMMQTISISTNSDNRMSNILDQSLPLPGDNNYYTWEDSFDNAQYIDENNSDYFLVQDGKAVMYATFPQWTNAEWTRMKIVTLSSEIALDDALVKLIVEYDSDMRSDYGDLRFKFNNDDYWLPYWIEEKNPQSNEPYAIVWIRIASLPEGESNVSVFYGNPDATDGSDYWSVFDENSWQNYYAHDHKISYHMENEGAWDPDVIWGDNKFFVTWEEGIPRYIPLGMIYKQQIRGCFYSEEGEPIGERFDITEWNTDPTTPFRCENPSSAYGSDGDTDIFFVAYEYYNTPSDPVSRDIKGALVATDASTIYDVTHFDICISSGNQADPVVAYDDENQRFFVVWEDGREGTSNYNLYGKFFDIEGNPIGSEKIISDAPNNQCEPWMTFDDVNNHFMIVWEEGVNAENGPFDIWGQLFTTNGDPLGDAILISPQGSSTVDYNFPCVAFCRLTERFLITWQEDDISSGEWYGHIWGKILDENGNAAVDTFKIANGAFERTNIVPHLSSSFFVVYDGGGDIWGKLINSEGSVNPYVLQISDSESDPADWANIASSGDHIFVAWEDLRVEYPSPYDGLDLPDIYTNIWSFNTPGCSEIYYNTSGEHSLVLNSHIVSDPISPSNLNSWHMFEATKQGDISFDIVHGKNPTEILMADVSSGANIGSILTSSIRLKATFHRNNPSSSPFLDSWRVMYVGEDNEPPETTVEDIEGVQGLNEWYISESVILWLHAEDFPKDTGSGIESIYYSLNGRDQQVYNAENGLQLSTSKSSKWMGEWEVVFWAKDRNGNIESRYDSENKRVIKIDADLPYVQISSPANEEQVETPFWVKAEPTDNVGIDRVEFDIEPFGEREGLPFVDTDPPYEWYCDVEQGDGSRSSLGLTGVNVMIRAQAFDESGQSWIDEKWVYITNWESSGGFTNGLGIIIGIGQSNAVVESVPSSVITERLPSCLHLGKLQWNFEDGFSASAGTNGVFRKMGFQSGSAQLFFGIAGKNSPVFAGVGLGIFVE
ncbi:MAG: DUF2341 domain-containing protein [Candidatus Thermoplasmatota archaeon]|nr:DUF2341 domain-containing protein [Candidatus Thermoplasmatota archaeon]